MATPDSKSAGKGGMTTRRKIGYALLAILIILLILFFWNLSFIKGQSRVGAGYAAHVICSCRYIGGRDMASCESDKEDGMEIISLADDPENKRVTASVPFFAHDVAEYRDGYGCINLTEEEVEALD